MLVYHQRLDDLTFPEVRLEPARDRPVVTDYSHRAVSIGPPIDAGDHGRGSVVEGHLDQVAILNERSAVFRGGLNLQPHGRFSFDVRQTGALLQASGLPKPTYDLVKPNAY